MNEYGRVRFRYPGKPWGPWFKYWVEIPQPRKPCRPKCPLCPVYTGKPELARNMIEVSLGAWKTDHRYRCNKCKRTFLGGPGTLSGYDDCPKCGHNYWTWESYGE